MIDQESYAQKLKEEYSTKEKSKLDELHLLNSKVKKAPTIFAYIFGVISALILGTGMCLAMNIIGGTTVWVIVGIVVGVVGIILMSLTYLIYSKMLFSRKKKYSAEIISLSNEILKDK